MNMKTGVVVWLAGSMMVLAEGASAPPVQAVEAGSVKSDKTFEVSTLLSSGRENLLGGRYTEAEALFEKARALDSSNNEAVFGLSAVYIETKRYAEALPLLERLNKDVPDNPMVKNNLAWALLHIKDKASVNAPRAIKLARSAIIDVPSDYSIWNTLGEAYYASGEFEKALRAAQSGLRLSVLAGITNSPCGELVSRCRKAAGAASLETMNSDRPE